MAAGALGTHLGESFLQSVLTLLQEVIISQQVCGMLPSIPQQQLHAFQLTASRLQHWLVTVISTDNQLNPDNSDRNYFQPRPGAC